MWWIFGIGIVVGAAAASSASWFYYSHAIASKVTDAVDSVKAHVQAVDSKISSVKADVATIAKKA